MGPGHKGVCGRVANVQRLHGHTTRHVEAAHCSLNLSCLADLFVHAQNTEHAHSTCNMMGSLLAIASLGSLIFPLGNWAQSEH